MAKNHWDKKEIIIVILILLGGIALTSASFCIYYLVKPLHPAIIAAICVVDFLYTLFITCLACKALPTDKWLLKGILVSVGYIAVFIIVAVLFFHTSKAFDLTTAKFITIVLYAFFTSPCIFIVMALALLCLAYCP